MEKFTLTVDEAGKLLGIGRNAAYEAVRTGAIPSIRIGKRLLVPRMAIDNMMASASIQINQTR